MRGGAEPPTIRLQKATALVDTEDRVRLSEVTGGRKAVSFFCTHLLRPHGAVIEKHEDKNAEDHLRF